MSPNPPSVATGVYTSSNIFLQLVAQLALNSLIGYVTQTLTFNSKADFEHQIWKEQRKIVEEVVGQHSIPSYKSFYFLNLKVPRISIFPCYGPGTGRGLISGNFVHVLFCQMIFDFLYERTPSRRRNSDKNMTFANFGLKFHNFPG